MKNNSNTNSKAQSPSPQKTGTANYKSTSQSANHFKDHTTKNKTSPIKRGTTQEIFLYRQLIEGK